MIKTKTIGFFFVIDEVSFRHKTVAMSGMGSIPSRGADTWDIKTHLIDIKLKRVNRIHNHQIVSACAHLFVCASLWLSRARNKVGPRGAASPATIELEIELVPQPHPYMAPSSKFVTRKNILVNLTASSIYVA